MIETEVMDKLFLELSQFTRAKTQREIWYEEAIEKALRFLKDATPKDRNGPCIRAIDVLVNVLTQSENNDFE